MTLNHAWLCAALAVALTVLSPGLLRAGGITFTDEDAMTDEGPSFFGFVREVDGPGVADAKVTASLDKSGALVTRTDIMGVYKIPGFGKDVNPNDIKISCSKDGYAEASVERRPQGDPKDPIEIECYLKKK